MKSEVWVRSDIDGRQYRYTFEVIYRDQSLVRVKVTAKNGKEITLEKDLVKQEWRIAAANYKFTGSEEHRKLMLLRMQATIEYYVAGPGLRL
jgi:hypothetical protein